MTSQSSKGQENNLDLAEIVDEQNNVYCCHWEAGINGYMYSVSRAGFLADSWREAGRETGLSQALVTGTFGANARVQGKQGVPVVRKFYSAAPVGLSERE